MISTQITDANNLKKVAMRNINSKPIAGCSNMTERAYKLKYNVMSCLFFFRTKFQPKYKLHMLKMNVVALLKKENVCAPNSILSPAKYLSVTDSSCIYAMIVRSDEKPIFPIRLNKFMNCKPNISADINKLRI